MNNQAEQANIYNVSKPNTKDLTLEEMCYNQLVSAMNYHVLTLPALVSYLKTMVLLNRQFKFFRQEIFKVEHTKYNQSDITDDLIITVVFRYVTELLSKHKINNNVGEQYMENLKRVGNDISLRSFLFSSVFENILTIYCNYYLDNGTLTNKMYINKIDSKSANKSKTSMF